MRPKLAMGQEITTRHSAADIPQSLSRMHSVTYSDLHFRSALATVEENQTST